MSAGKGMLEARMDQTCGLVTGSVPSAMTTSLLGTNTAGAVDNPDPPEQIWLPWQLLGHCHLQIRLVRGSDREAEGRCDLPNVSLEL